MDIQFLNPKQFRIVYYSIVIIIVTTLLLVTKIPQYFFYLLLIEFLSIKVISKYFIKRPDTLEIKQEVKKIKPISHISCLNYSIDRLVMMLLVTIIILAVAFFIFYSYMFHFIALVMFLVIIEYLTSTKKALNQLTPDEKKSKPIYVETKISIVVTSGKLKWLWQTRPESYATRPFCRISFYKTFLILRIGAQSFKLNYRDINIIKKSTTFSFSSYGDAVTMIFAIQIAHHNKNVPKYICISASKDTKNNLLKAIKKVTKNKIKIV